MDMRASTHIFYKYVDTLKRIHIMRHTYMEDRQGTRHRYPDIYLLTM